FKKRRYAAPEALRWRVLSHDALRLPRLGRATKEVAPKSQRTARAVDSQLPLPVLRSGHPIPACWPGGTGAWQRYWFRAYCHGFERVRIRRRVLQILLDPRSISNRNGVLRGTRP